MSFHEELKIAIDAAEKASKIIKKFSEERMLNIRSKGLNDLLTDADLAAEESIIKTIRNSFPSDSFLAEESSPSLDSLNGRVWIIDPIDGTTNFSHGFGVYCVSIALWIDGIAKVGVIKQVVSNELFYAIKGGGSFLNNKAISVSKNSELLDSLIFTGFPYTDFHLVDHYLALFKNLMQKIHGLRRPGAASYDLCMVACGRADGFFEYGLNAWDVAAGSLIIQEAGGIVSDWAYSNNYLLGKRIVAGNHHIQSKLLDEIHIVFPEYKLDV